MAEAYLGEIRLFAISYVPDGWMICHGQELSIQQHTPLYALLGITYGGDGRNTFKIPDLRGRVPMQTGTSAFGTVEMGTVGGMKATTVTSTGTVTLTSVDQLPAHTHAASINVSKDNGASATPTEGAYLGAVKSATIAAAPSLYTSSATATLNAATVKIDSAGAITPQPIGVTVKADVAPVLPPCLGMFYAICTSGIFPPRP